VFSLSAITRFAGRHSCDLSVLRREGNWTTQTLPTSYTTANYVPGYFQIHAPVRFSSTAVDVGNCRGAALLWSCCVAGLIRKKGSRKWKRLLSWLILVPWALPGTVVAVSLARSLRKTIAVVRFFHPRRHLLDSAVVYFLRFMPLVVRAMQASMEQIDAALEEAASSLGANWWQRWTRVTLPLVWPGAIAGTLLAFVIALGEYVASVLVFVPANRPISIAIASELRDFNLGTAAAYGVILMLMIGLIMMVATRLERLRG
jgi:iron(III) transport system permease protein